MSTFEDRLRQMAEEKGYKLLPKIERNDQPQQAEIKKPTAGRIMLGFLILLTIFSAIIGAIVSIVILLFFEPWALTIPFYSGIYSGLSLFGNLWNLLFNAIPKTLITEYVLNWNRFGMTIYFIGQMIGVLIIVYFPLSGILHFTKKALKGIFSK